MKAVTFGGVGQVEVGEVAMPRLAEPGDALVRVALSAVCGSDLHIYHGHSPVDEGATLGHEFVGVVEEAGPAVRSVRAGDRVVASFYTACGRCRLCRRGWWSQCESRAIFSHGRHFGLVLA